MRQLHPVSIREKFVASGIYRYFIGDQPTGDIETWSMHQPSPNAYTIRADYDGRAGGGLNLLVEALYTVNEHGGRIDRFDLHLFHGQVQAEAAYTFGDDYAQFTRRVGGEANDQQEITLQPGFLVSAPALVTRFLFVPAFVTRTRQSGSVFVATTDTEQIDIQGGNLQIYSIETIGSDQAVVGAAVIPVTGYAISDADGNTFNAWFDRHDVLIHCELENGKRAALTEYARRPER